MGKIESILLVDDSPACNALTKIYLKKINLCDNIDAVLSANLALEYIEKKIPSLAFIDINMPAVSGFDLLDTLKEKDLLKKMKVCVLSSSKTESDISKIKQFKGVKYISKPVNTEKLQKFFSEL